MHDDRISMELFILYFKGSQVEIFNANIGDLDEILHHATFHLGLHCLQKYLFPE